MKKRQKANPLTSTLQLFQRNGIGYYGMNCEILNEINMFDPTKELPVLFSEDLLTKKIF